MGVSAMYAKLDGNTIQKIPINAQLANGAWVSNYNLLPDAILKAEGWKTLIEVKPEYNEETQYLEQDSIAEGEETITVTYVAVDIPPNQEELLLSELEALLS